MWRDFFVIIIYYLYDTLAADQGTTDVSAIKYFKSTSQYSYVLYWILDFRARSSGYAFATVTSRLADAVAVSVMVGGSRGGEFFEPVHLEMSFSRNLCDSFPSQHSTAQHILYHRSTGQHRTMDDWTANPSPRRHHRRVPLSFLSNTAIVSLD